MGQQVPFETLDDVAEGLLAEDRRRRGVRSSPVARTVQLGDQRLQRLELKLGGQGGERDVHVYEAYWAPLTEGQVKLRDVTRFLFSAGVNGIRAARVPFRRWLFGMDAEFPAPVRTVIYLLVALVVLLSLGALNALIVAIPAARAPLHDPPSWLSDGLVQDITTILNVLVTVFALFIVTIAVAMRVSRPNRAMGWLSIAAFGLAVWTTTAAAITSAVVVAYHARRPPEDRSSLFDQFDAGFFRPGAALRVFDGAFDWLAVTLVALLAAGLLLLWIVRIHGALNKDVTYNPKTKKVTKRVRTAFMFFIGSLVALAVVLISGTGAATAALRHGLAWPLTVAASAAVRWFLIEFAGDVAAYVQPQVVDRFFELRKAIKEAVWRTAHAIYSTPDYEDIIVVGHSLGSVVVYDVLNRLILDREVGAASAPEIVPRTRLLLTFGSPLDKTAFVFGIQGPGTEVGAARRALAASVQPLITHAVRPPWVNIYSPWDIISGALDYYDLPDHANRSLVANEPDKAATTLLAAHVEYWKNPHIFRAMLDRLP